MRSSVTDHRLSGPSAGFVLFAGFHHVRSFTGHEPIVREQLAVFRAVVHEHRAQVRVGTGHRRVRQLSVPERPRDRVPGGGGDRRPRPGGAHPEVRAPGRAAEDHHRHGSESDQVRVPLPLVTGTRAHVVRATPCGRH